MPSPNSLRRKLTNKVIKRFGIETKILRADSTIELDGYGEPIGMDTRDAFEEIDVIIVIDQDRRIAEETAIGGMPDAKKEFIHFYVAGDFEIKTGDKVIYPAGTDNEWLVNRIEPNVFKGVTVISECRASRDRRY